MKLIGIVRGDNDSFAHESNLLVEMTPAEYRGFQGLRNAVANDKSLSMSSGINQDLSAEIAAVRAWAETRFRLNALKECINNMEHTLGVQKTEGGQ